MGFIGYTVRCRCYALTTHVTNEAVVQGGEDYALDVAHQRWKEVVDKMHMPKENPGSEETGVDSDAVWEAVLDAMFGVYIQGRRDHEQWRDNISRDRLREVLTEKLNEVRESSDPPSEDHQW